MVKFNNYEHFMAYCFAILKNKKEKPSKREVWALNSISNIFKYLDGLSDEKIIKYSKESFYYRVVSRIGHDDYKQVVPDVVKTNEEIQRCIEGEYSLNTLMGDLRFRFSMNITYTDDLIIDNNVSSNLYPKKIKVLELYEDENEVNLAVSSSRESGDRPGVYFIYDNDNVLAYIGVSVASVESRGMQSAKERGLLDFSRIEFYITDSKTEANIYEIYYIQKYKPYLNTMYIYDESPKITLPDLNVFKTIVRTDKYYKYKYRYYKQRNRKTLEIVENLGKDILLYNYENRDYLDELGYKDKGAASRDMMLKLIDEINISEASCSYLLNAKDNLFYKLQPTT